MGTATGMSIEPRADDGGFEHEAAHATGAVPVPCRRHNERVETVSS